MVGELINKERNKHVAWFVGGLGGFITSSLSPSPKAGTTNFCLEKCVRGGRALFARFSYLLLCLFCFMFVFCVFANDRFGWFVWFCFRTRHEFEQPMKTNKTNQPELSFAKTSKTHHKTINTKHNKKTKQLVRARPWTLS